MAHWQTEQDKQALTNFRAHNRKVAELKKDLWDFQQIFWSPSFPEQKAWALQMVKSIENELHQLES